MAPNVKIHIEDFGLRYSDGTESLHGITLDIYANQINVLFGPSGGGKSSLLRAMNRLNDLTDVVKQTGHILLDGEDVTHPATTSCACAGAWVSSLRGPLCYR